MSIQKKHQASRRWGWDVGGGGGDGGTVRARVRAGEDTLRGGGRPRATPAISRAPASAELERVSRSHAGFAPPRPPPTHPKQNTEVICNKRISCLLSPPFQKVPLHRKSVVSSLRGHPAVWAPMEMSFGIVVPTRSPL